MSGFLKQMLFGDIGNWWHQQDMEVNSVKQRNAIRRTIQKNYDVDEDQERRIIQLEILTGSLLGIIREKELIDDDELMRMVDLAESEAKIAVPQIKRKKTSNRHSRISS